MSDLLPPLPDPKEIKVHWHVEIFPDTDQSIFFRVHGSFNFRGEETTCRRIQHVDPPFFGSQEKKQKKVEERVKRDIKWCKEGIRQEIRSKFESYAYGENEMLKLTPLLGPAPIDIE